MNKLYYFLCCVNCFLFIDDLVAQNKNENGFAASLSVSAPVNHKLDISLLAASKASFEENVGRKNGYRPKILEIYGQALGSYMVNKNWHIGAGYGFQRNNPFFDDWRNEQRLVEQVIFSSVNKNAMWYARLRFEERWFTFSDHTNDFATRTRLQLGYALPLGPHKIYWQVNDEVFFNSAANISPFLSENWAYTGIGFNVEYVGHMETGIGFDTNVNKKGGKTNLLLFQVAWSRKIKAKDENMMNTIIRNRHF